MCTLPANHDGGCAFPETWLDPKTGKTVDVANHGRVTADRDELPSSEEFVRLTEGADKDDDDSRE